MAHSDQRGAGQRLAEPAAVPPGSQQPVGGHREAGGDK